MEINGKPVNLFFSVYAKCELDRLVMVSGLRNVAEFSKKLPSEFVAGMAVAMSKAYCMAHGGEPITRAEVDCLQAKEFGELDNLVAQAFTDGEAVSVFTEEPKGKNADGAAK